MAGLEDLFLKKNVPGRYSSWAEENDDRRGVGGGNDEIGDGSEDDEYYMEGLPTPASQTPAATQPQQPLLRKSGGNTGVKGVLADYREAQQEEQLRREEERLDTLRAFDRATRPAVRSECVSDKSSVNKKNNDSNEDSDDDYLDDSDDEFLKQFRNQRLTELQNISSAAKATTALNPLLPTYGSLTSTTPEEYVDMVDKLDPRTHLIVHLYESTIQQSRMLHSALEKVATCMEHTKFIEVNALEANPNLDTICLPAVLVYRGGKLIHNLVRFTEELPRGFGMEEVREVLGGLLK